MNEREAQEASRFAESGDSHNLPEIQNWYSQNFLSHNMKKVFQVSNFPELIIKKVKEMRKSGNEIKIVSVGAGHGQIERSILNQLSTESEGNTKIISLDLFSPNDSEIFYIGDYRYELIRRKVDLNNPDFIEKANIYMAHHSLHHLVELDNLFLKLKESLIETNGVLIISDMIGRNGHMRWPETLHAIREIWKTLPIELKFNNQFNSTDIFFENWDCSNEGFEGIKSQQIMKYLLKHFYQDTAIFWGGVLDPFIDRGFGPNFKLDNVEHIKIINSIIKCENELSAKSLIWPTQVIGIFNPKNSISFDVSLTDRFRNPEELITSDKFENIRQIINKYFCEQKEYKAEKMVFGKTYKDTFLLRKLTTYGWDFTDSHTVWAVGLESEVIFCPEKPEPFDLKIGINLVQNVVGSKIDVYNENNLLVSTPILDREINISINDKSEYFRIKFICENLNISERNWRDKRPLHLELRHLIISAISKK